MRSAIELSNIHDIAFVFEHGCFVIVDIEIIRRRENSHNRREAGGLGFPVHPISGQGL